MFRAVGFGQIPSGGAGTKYRTTTRISSVQGGVIYTPPTICQGDSGGPLLLVNEDGTDTVVGIASFGSGACGGGINGYNRVDQFLDLIDEAVRLSGTCVDDGEERCDGYDNDCNDLVDEVCADVGEACEGDDDCLSLTCRDGLCTQGCDPMRPFTGCPPGFYCGGSAGCEGFCVAGTAGALPVNSACTADTDCDSLFCTNPFSPGSDEGKTCLEPCRGGDGRCIDGQVCAAGVGACGRIAGQRGRRLAWARRALRRGRRVCLRRVPRRARPRLLHLGLRARLGLRDRLPLPHGSRPVRRGRAVAASARAASETATAPTRSSARRAATFAGAPRSARPTRSPPAAWRSRRVRADLRAGPRRGRRRVRDRRRLHLRGL
ncbi:MAG: trypsin-like serine protease [Polyangiales bacterium]